MAIDHRRRLVIDTNVWVSAFINPLGAPARLLNLALDGRLILILSTYLIDEILDVCRRERVRRRLHLSPEQIEARLMAACEQAVMVETRGILQICRDPDDDAILETAIYGGADYLVSRDDDLKRDPALADQLSARGIQVLTVARFLDLLEAEPA
jgi:putative PIN family toxin of toxin-antitoxin system